MKTIVLILIQSVITLAVSSCYQFKEASCQEVADEYKADHLNLVVKKKPYSAYKLRIDGFDPASKENRIFRRQNYTWAQSFILQIAVGDTVIKHKGELKFYIHKKDTVLVFPFECDGKVYE
ncbi:hypothetical protein [Dyadobacter aurulentus]|uniref:hypothetical protein n=1 Tax=Dyadobacter sp. UC 10 TaxID=2605428 RepID=UPI0011F166D5|nr:hypothetical protein [Dyadobacter sp. UC 10]KAA0992800.1 hypothetical protein FXO21_22790 [Dyadobacter sp. UC 10]